MTNAVMAMGSPNGALLQRIFNAFRRQVDGFEAMAEDLSPIDGLKHIAGMVKTFEALLNLGERGGAGEETQMDASAARAELIARMEKFADMPKSATRKRKADNG